MVVGCLSNVCQQNAFGKQWTKHAHSRWQGHWQMEMESSTRQCGEEEGVVVCGLALDPDLILTQQSTLVVSDVHRGTGRHRTPPSPPSPVCTAKAAVPL